MHEHELVCKHTHIHTHRVTFGIKIRLREKKGDYMENKLDMFFSYVNLFIFN